MYVGCACGAIYRVRDEKSVPPKKCPACSGELQVGYFRPGPPPPEGPDPRIEELGARVAELEKEQAAGQATVELKDKDLAVAGRRIEALEKELAEAREQAASAGALETMESELAAAQDRIGVLEKDLAAALADVERKGDELANAQVQVEDLSRSVEQLRPAAEQAKTLEEQVSSMEGRLKENVQGRDQETEVLQKRVEHLEEIRRAEHESYETRIRARESIRARVSEARYLAADLDRNLESLASALSGLTDRVKRLYESLHTDEPELETVEDASAEDEMLDVPSKPAPEPPAAPPEDPPSPPPPAEEGSASVLEEVAPAPVEEVESLPEATDGGVPLISSPAEDGAPVEEAAADEAPVGEGEPREDKKKKGFLGKLFGKKK